MISKFFWIFLEKGGVTLFQFLTLLLLGRLLAPDTFGVYGTMIIYISIAETLIDSGFGGAIVQKKEINQQDINTLFYFNITISFVSYIILFLVSPYIESFYKIEKLSLYFRVLGCTMIFYSFSLIQISLMNRKLQFKKSSALNLASYLCASLIAIVLAFCGCGIWSLIFQLVFSSLFLAIFCWEKAIFAAPYNLFREFLAGRVRRQRLMWRLGPEYRSPPLSLWPARLP